MGTASTRSLPEVLETLDAIAWDSPAATNMVQSAVAALEDGKVLYFPRLAFSTLPPEKRFFSPAFADEKAKNISFDPATGQVRHAVGTPEDISAISSMLKRFHDTARQFVTVLLPQYAGRLQSGRTSFRPVEVQGRKLSARKDDSRLHVDAFPSTPTAGTRILRVFSNVNPEGRGRDWLLGAPFEDVARQFAPRVRPQMPGSAWLFNAIGATKSRRTAYDHLMLNIHDAMKQDDTYQAQVVKNDFSFPPGSTWIVFTDKTSHAALGGQHLFEQTFYVPVEAMLDPSKAPIRILERLTGSVLA